MAIPADFVPAICHYCGKREATGLREDRKSGEKIEVCSSHTCLEHTRPDQAHPWPTQTLTEQPALF